ncbi:MAG: GTP 3',8-cyclase MoaA [Oleiphilaceae bacterium]|nr:GTP 3',8-cyclase MoaA [Oleiphilaceae bacterium]
MPLIDRFGREVNYLRLSVTDRCDFRCVYCMDEQMEFVPREQVLTLEELQQVAEAFVALGVSKVRLTGGEPLVRANVLSLVESLGKMEGLKELVMTTNGSQLPRYAKALKQAGLARLNISLDSLNPERFKALTRTGNVQQVLDGIAAAQAAGFSRIKLNAVILKGRNDDEVITLVDYAVANGLDISFIEEMPLGQISEHSRREAFLSSESLRSILAQAYRLSPLAEQDSRSGPSRYYTLQGTQSRVGFISPHSQNFCGDCNRVRVTTEGRLLLCLGNEHSVDLRAVLRAHPGDQPRLRQTIIDAMQIKPERHHFTQDDAPAVLRFMNMTGG